MEKSTFDKKTNTNSRINKQVESEKKSVPTFR